MNMKSLERTTHFQIHSYSFVSLPSGRSRWTFSDPERVVGKLIYLTITRSDLSFAVGVIY